MDEKPKLVVNNVIDLDSKRKPEEFTVELEEHPHTGIAEMLENAKDDLSKKNFLGGFLTLVEDNAKHTMWNYAGYLSQEEEVLFRQLASEQVFAEWREAKEEDD